MVPGSLPPVEVAEIDHSRLRVPTQPRRWKIPALRVPRFAPILLFFLAASPLAFAWVSQPHGPNLSSTNQQLVSAYLDESGRTGDTALVADASETPAPSPTDSPLPEAQLTSSAETGTYAYHLSLAQGFLTKAVTESQSTSQAQTESQRSAILAYLQQALEAANKAIEMEPTQGIGFLVRARVYKTASAVKPELGPMAEQDLTIARALGINGDSLTIPNPLEHLPTVVAAPEEGKTTTVSAETSTNTLSGRVILPTGNRTVDVSFPGLTPQMNLRVDPVDEAQNSNNAIFTIVTRQEGVGFTIQSTLPAPQDVVLEWRAITQ